MRRSFDNLLLSRTGTIHDARFNENINTLGDQILTPCRLLFNPLILCIFVRTCITSFFYKYASSQCISHTPLKYITTEIMPSLIFLLLYDHKQMKEFLMLSRKFRPQWHFLIPFPNTKISRKFIPHKRD